MSLAVEGSSRAATARALGLSPSTVRRWLARAAVHAQAFNDAKLREVSAVELQSDELKVRTEGRQAPLWTYTAVEVWSRLWLTSLVGRRTLRNTLLHFREARWRCRVEAGRTLVTTDAFKYNERVIARVFGPTCVHAQVEKRYRKGRVVRAERRLVLGQDWMLDEALGRSEDSKSINTSYVERLNLTIRRSLACLQRKTTAMCRSEASLREQLELLRCYYNFIRPHSSLKFGRKKRTPAQQAGLVAGPLSWRRILSARILGTPRRSPLATMRDGGRACAIQGHRIRGRGSNS
ncbi:helix-turn-helix domain-containing protein [Engelhardtia mirabilis]|uniref:helix-turn-helix domain-containing protein n=1 Tax=Engelhardtia mirabilis TaxID=2528011 RepID=UPI003AF3729B